MRLLTPELWTFWVAIGLMVVGAVISLRSLTVPNRLTLTATLVGWYTALLVGGSGGILASLAAAAISLLLLLPFYAVGGLGAGCVKMQMAFGAWVGCGVGVAAASRLAVSGIIFGVVFTAFGMAIAIWRGWVGLFPAQVTLSLGSICGAAVLLLVGWV